LAAYLVPARELAPEAVKEWAQQLRLFLRQSLPEQYVPSAWQPLEALPRNPNGKIDRRALLKPEQLSPQPAREQVPPRTPLEQRLAVIWQEILQTEQVGVHDDFFESGGHSILATRMVNRVRQDLSVQLALRDFFAAPTLAGLAESIEKSRREEVEEADRIARILDRVKKLSESEVRTLSAIEKGEAS
jgi:acyl carrier protein